MHHVRQVLALDMHPSGRAIVSCEVLSSHDYWSGAVRDDVSCGCAGTVWEHGCKRLRVRVGPAKHGKGTVRA